MTNVDNNIEDVTDETEGVVIGNNSRTKKGVNSIVCDMLPVNRLTMFVSVCSSFRDVRGKQLSKKSLDVEVSWLKSVYLLNTVYTIQIVYI